MSGSIVVTGAMAQRPRQGGHTWVFLQYLLGFRRLGWDALFIDQLDPALCVDAAGRSCPPEESLNVRDLVDVLDRVGLGDAVSLLLGDERPPIGLPRTVVVERTGHSALLLNVMGFLTDEEILGAAPKRVFLDIDPGFDQMWRDLGLADQFRDHDAFVRIGENIGRPKCTIPTCGLDWITTPQPIVLDLWSARPGGEKKGLIAFRTPDEVVEGADRIARDYEQHSHAARAIAQTYFDSDIVLRRFAGEAGVAP